MRNKAWRRKQEFKKKRKVEKNHYNWWWGDSPRMIGKKAHAPKFCSCWMYGNPRKYFNDKTIQEQKNERMRELLESL